MTPLLSALYVGPDQMMPLASILATILGMIMIFWNKVLGLWRKFLGVFKRSGSDAASAGAPAESPKDPSQHS